jgi:hypothetical protein
MQGIKKHYMVYLIETFNNTTYDETICEHKTEIGDTWAVSPSKAISNVRYRHRTPQKPNGGYSCSVMDIGQERSIIHSYAAEEI